jgi:type IV secretory pathway VirB10-like protein
MSLNPPRSAYENKAPINKFGGTRAVSDGLNADARPAVAYPERPWVLVVGLVGALALGSIVFTSMVSAQKRAGVDDVIPTRDAKNDGGLGQRIPEAPALFPPAPAMPVPEMAPVPESPAANEAVPAPIAPTPSPAVDPFPRQRYEPMPPPIEPESTRRPTDMSQRMRSPALVVDLVTSNSTNAGAIPANPAGGGGENDAFAARVGSGEVTAARAATLRSPKTTVPQGALIAAVLETAINSDLPGFVRAVVSRDVLSFDGTKVLIPKGSRLIGQYRSEVAIGQSRAFVVWTRLLRPDGVSVQLASPATDTLGRAGLAGRVDRHYLQRYGPALLSTAVSAALDNRQSNQLVIGTAQNSAGGALGGGEAIKPTVIVKQGTAIQVFVARDLDFSLNYPPPMERSAPEPQPEAGSDE